jgi:excisionase family DNA binding protein
MSIGSTGLSRAERAGGARGGSAKLEPLAVSILEAARLTSLCRSTIYVLINAGKLKATRVMGRNLVDYQTLKELMRTGDTE